MEPLPGVFQKGIDRRAALGIAVGGEVALRLVKKKIRFRGFGERFPVESDSVAVEIYPVVWRLDDLAIDTNPARADPTSGIHAGAEARFREDAVERFQCAR